MTCVRNKVVCACHRDDFRVQNCAFTMNFDNQNYLFIHFIVPLDVLLHVSLRQR